MVHGTVASAAPERSLEQRMEALSRANAVRAYRKDVKADLKFGRRAVADVVAGGDDALDSMKVWELLLAAPKIGRVKASRMLRDAGVSPSKTVGGLSDRQRRELVAALGGVPRGASVRPL